MNAKANPISATATGGNGGGDPAAAAFAGQWRDALESEIARYTVIVDDLHTAADRAAAKHDALVAMSEANRDLAAQQAADGDTFLATLQTQLDELEGR